MMRATALTSGEHLCAIHESFSVYARAETGGLWMSHAFETFLATRREDLHRIARRTRGEYALEEVQSEAWVTAMQIADRRDWPFDFSDQDDQDQLLAWLHNRLVKYAEKTVRYAVRMEHGRDEDSERTGATLARLLTARIDSDPEVRQLLAEERGALLERIQQSYSQAAAYVLLLLRVEGELAELAVLLGIACATLRDRLRRLGLLARIQPTLFDGIERTDPDFSPNRRKSNRLQRLVESNGQRGFWQEVA